MSGMQHALHKIAPLEALPPGSRKLCTISGRRIAVFNVNGTLHAIDNHCPHRGGPIGAGPLSETLLTCPWHGQQFDLVTGRGVEACTGSIHRYRVVVNNATVYVDLSAPDQAPVGEDSILRYLVRYGSLGHVGRFGSIRLIECCRGDRVIVQTDRGTELGEVLASPCDRQREMLPHDASPAGEMLRAMTDDDRQQERALQEISLADLLEKCRELMHRRRLPIAVLDAELLFDGRTVIVYFLGEATERLGPLAVQLNRLLPDRHIRFELVDTLAAAGDVQEGHPIEQASEAKENQPVKGPYERLKFDLRRLWECPACSHRERTGGDVTYMLCRCQAKEAPGNRTYMKLVEDGFSHYDQKPRPRRRSSLPELQLDAPVPNAPSPRPQALANREDLRPPQEDHRKPTRNRSSDDR